MKFTILNNNDKTELTYKYQDFVRDENGTLVHKSKLNKNKNTSISGSNNKNNK